MPLHPAVSKEDYDKWVELSDACTAPEIHRRSEKLFTIPGLMTAYVADSIGLKAMETRPDYIVKVSYDRDAYYSDHIARERTFLSYLDFSDQEYDQLFGREHYGTRIFRNIEERARTVTVTDMLYLDNGKMLYFVYPVQNQSHYYNGGIDRVLHYNFDGVSSFVDWTGEDWLLICQYIRDYCDQMSIGFYYEKYRENWKTKQ